MSATRVVDRNPAAAATRVGRTVAAQVVLLVVLFPLMLSGCVVHGSRLDSDGRASISIVHDNKAFHGYQRSGPMPREGERDTRAR